MCILPAPFPEICPEYIVQPIRGNYERQHAKTNAGANLQYYRQHHNQTIEQLCQRCLIDLHFMKKKCIKKNIQIIYKTNLHIK